MSHNKEWGPGRWQSIHVTAAWADTSEKFKMFCTWIRDQLTHLPCEECTKHALAYLESNPPEKSEDAFMWSWRFHNSVNRRLGKQEMEYTTAKQIYLEGGMKVCGKGCDESVKKDVIPKAEETFTFRPSRF
jgi:hypothetical protein